MAKMASVGKLRHRLKIKKPVRTDDGGGSGKVEFEDAGVVFGNIMPTGGGETFFGMQLEKRVPTSSPYATAGACGGGT